MKNKSVYFILLALLLLVVTNDDFLVRVGLQDPPIEALSGEEMMAINRELGEAQLPPLSLEKVTLKRISDSDPMHDTQLVFTFDRPLSEIEQKGFGRRIFQVSPWRYSIGVWGKHELAEYRPIRTLDVSQSDPGNLELVFYETTMHPKPFRRDREFVEYANATFTPDGLQDFQLCLYRWNGYLDSGNKFHSLTVEGEWRMSDLKRISETEWVVPDDFDPTPSAEAIRFYEEEMDIIPPP